MSKQPLLYFLEKKTIRPNGYDGCWIWTGAVTPSGHGITTYDGKSTTVHRHVWVYLNEPLCREIFVRHKCDNPPCWNPNHLVLGTVQDNSDDMTSRNRSNKGSKRPAAKLTEDAVAAIRKEYAAGDTSQRQLAIKYAVNQSNISRAVAGNRWTHVSE